MVVGRKTGVVIVGGRWRIVRRWRRWRSGGSSGFVGMPLLRWYLWFVLKSRCRLQGCKVAMRYRFQGVSTSG